MVIVWCAMLATKKGEQVREFKKGVMPFLVILGFTSLLILLRAQHVHGGAGRAARRDRAVHRRRQDRALPAARAGGGDRRPAADPAGAGTAPTGCDNFLNGAERHQPDLHQSLVGIGSGGVFGVGFGQGQQKLGYLPYAYSDFIFSTIGEEWGFLGVLLIVLLFGIFCWLGFRIARTAEDPVRPVSGDRAHRGGRASPP